MSISQGSKALRSDIEAIYTAFNNFISNYGGTITQLSVPGTKIDENDVNNLNSKVVEFQNDQYLGTQSSWWVEAATMVQGDPIVPFSFGTTITNMDNVKCRNDAYHSHQVNSHGSKSHEKNSHQKNSHTTRSYDNKSHTGRSYDFNSQGRNNNGGKSQGTCSNNKKSNGSMGNGKCGNGSNSNTDKSNTVCQTNGTCSHTSKKNTTYIDITNAYTNA